jgi:hypothetical protein
VGEGDGRADVPHRPRRPDSARRRIRVAIERLVDSPSLERSSTRRSAARSSFPPERIRSLEERDLHRDRPKARSTHRPSRLPEPYHLCSNENLRAVTRAFSRCCPRPTPSSTRPSTPGRSPARARSRPTILKAFALSVRRLIVKTRPTVIVCAPPPTREARSSRRLLKLAAVAATHSGIPLVSLAADLVRELLDDAPSTERIGEQYPELRAVEHR